MNKTILAIVLILFVGGGAAFALMNKDKNDNDKSQANTATVEDHNSTNSSENQADDSSAEVQQGQVAIDIKDREFTPKAIKVKKGTTVTWTNQDSIEHDVAPDEPSDNFKGSVLLSKGQSYSFTFNAAGTFTYHCTPHPDMTASVEVVE